MILSLALGIAVLVLAVAVYVLARQYLRLRGERVITCPENEDFAAVEVDAKRAAVSALLGRGGKLRLQDCSRWPEKLGCGQECLAQIEAAPEDCLTRTMLTQWYSGSACALCGIQIGNIDWYKHKPALMCPDRTTLEWSDVPAETLPEILASHFPVCWDCHVVESVVREHADQVVVRPPHRSPGVPGPLPGVSEGGTEGDARSL